jgi:hypothetical protein
MLQLPKNSATMHTSFKQIQYTSFMSEIIFPEVGHVTDHLTVTTNESL